MEDIEYLQDQKKKNYLDFILASGATIVCYGAGSFGKHMLEILSRNGITIDYYADTYKYSNEFNGRRVLSLEDLTALVKQQSVIVLITSIVGGKEVFNMLTKAGISENALMLPLCLECFSNKQLPLLASFDIEQFEADAETIKDQMIDNTSHFVMDSLVSARLKWMPEDYTNAYDASVGVSGTLEYLPCELHEHLLGHPISFIDCGAFTGDTIKILYEYGITFAESWCFEPDAGNYVKLIKQIIDLNLYGTVHTENTGVYSKNGSICFIETNAEDARISESGVGDKIVVVSLDEYFAEKKVDYIKMDIEGAELKALCGALELIKRCRPILAISVYHYCCDITQIPMYLINNLNQYDFMLRHYSGAISGTVLFCIPKPLLSWK